MKKILFSILLFVTSSIFGQNNNLDFLKSPIHKGDPTMEDAVKWLSKNLAYRGGTVLIDNQGGSRETEYPCILKSDSLIQILDLNYDSLRNEIYFSVDNMGCYAGAYPTKSALIVIFLDNLSSYFNIDKNNNRVELRSWNFDKKGSSYSDRVLGYIKYDNYDSCSGVSLRSFYTLSFAVNIVDRDKEDKLKLTLEYLQNKTSAQQKKCRSFGACLAANTKILIDKSKSKCIDLLKKGDKILTYDIVNKVVEETEIESLHSVYHKNLVKLIFSNDTITCTKDHPFYIKNKGWGSLDPTKTLNNYSNYSKVVKIQKNDLFIFRDGGKIVTNKLIGIIDLKDVNGQMTYTITRLKKGNSYFANGILTGVEHLKKEDYNETTIGNKIFMDKNLNTTRFRNGDSVFFAKNKEEWALAGSQEIPAYCYPNFDFSEKSNGTMLYNYFAVKDKRGLAPFGWRIPNLEDIYSIRDEKLESQLVHLLNKNKSKESIWGWWTSDYAEEAELGRGILSWGGYVIHSGDSIVYTNERFSPEEAFNVICIKDTFIEFSKNKLVDIDGNVYKTERIGVQNIRRASSSDSFLSWTTSNLNVSKFKTGEAIIEAKSSAEWEDALNKGIPAWCYVDNDSSTGKKLGKLYNYYAVTSLKGLAPEGWHIADDYDWEIVFKTYPVKITEANLYEDWKIFMSPNWESPYGWGYGNNRTGFNALPSGYRAPYGFSKDGAYYWGYISLNRRNASFLQILGDNYMCDYGCEYTYQLGFSVRCVKDY